MLKYIFILLASVFLLSCEAKDPQINPSKDSILKTQYFKSEVITKSVFTKGIEGPYVNEQGEIYVVNFQQNGTIGKIHTDGRIEKVVVIPDSGIGNGIQRWNDSTLVIADYVNHVVWLMNDESYKMSVLAQEPRMNQPNDITVHSGGWLYASDPNWKDSNGKLWMVNADGSTNMLEDNMGTTNGICLSHDEKYLFVNESIQRKIWRYEVLDNGFLNNKTLFHQFDSAGLDGMKTLSKKWLLVTRYDAGEVVAFDFNGNIKAVYKLKGQKPTNVTVNKDESEAFVTMQDQKWVEKIKL